jgi:hypothetical protein
LKPLITYCSLIIAVFSSLNITCQVDKLKQYEFYGYKEGLPSNETYHIVQDKHKYIWIATDNGVAKYNGSSFKIFNTQNGLPDNTVYRLYPQKDGSILGEALNNRFFIIKNDSVILYKYNEIIAKHHKGYKRIYSVYVDKQQNYHFGSYYGYFYITAKGKLIEAVKSVYGDTCNSIGISSIENSFISYKTFVGNDIFRSYLKYQSNFNKNNYIYELNSQGNTAEADYCDLLNDTIKAIMFGKNIYLHNKDRILASTNILGTPVGVHCFDSLIWVCTKGGGVYCFTYKNKFIEKQHLFNGFTITSVLKDHENNYWFSTRENGIIKIAYSSISCIYNSTSTSKLNAFYKSDKFSLAGSEDGLVMDINTGNSLNGLPKYIVDIVNHRNSGLFIVADYTQKYLKLNSNSKLIQFKSPISHGKRAVIGIKIIDDSTSVINSKLNILIVNDITDKIIFESPRVAINDKITTIGVVGDTIYVSTDKKLTLYTKKGIYIREYLTNCLIIKIIDAGKYGVIATYKNGEIYKIEGSSLKVLHNNSDNLNRIYDGVFDGKLFCLSNGNAIYKYIIKNHGLELKSSKKLSGVSKIYLFKDSIYYLTSNKIYSELSSNIESENPPILNITQLKVNNKPYELNENISLPAKENNIEFFYDIISFSEGERKMRYKLLGLDTNYYYTSNSSLSFLKLQPGNYQLLVSCSNNGKDYSEEISTRFVILKPFWAEWWFILGLTALFVLLILLSVKYYVLKQKEKSNLNLAIANLKSKALASQLNPHLVFNILNSIQGIISENDIERANIYLAKFSKFMRKILNLSKQTSITITEEIEITNQYIELELLRFSKDVSINIDKFNVTNTYKIPPLCIQPFLENSIKHGIMPLVNKKGVINVRFIEKSNCLHICIEDNGIGFGSDLNTSAGDGIRISTERLKILDEKNEVILDSKINPTCIIIKLYLNV